MAPAPKAELTGLNRELSRLNPELSCPNPEPICPNPELICLSRGHGVLKRGHARPPGVSPAQEPEFPAQARMLRGRVGELPGQAPGF
ncbi:hypothetical protein Atai01_18010 [Amycolatopsis taiwanensis]|uniref:Uncharacterized protein n=1 Tax=Amycolatopsis taiwanensis TaxID=342230 RepID=A0A9W6VF72_9PSEU|nr:hypothetical protein Atai01_18010 [Amycolatopsis taiwanensis]